MDGHVLRLTQVAPCVQWKCFRARSSDWIERSPPKRQVGSSNLPVPTKTYNAGRDSHVNHSVRYFVFILMATASAFGAEPATARLLKQVEQRYNRAQTLEVQFSETYSGAGRAPRTESGKLYLRKPGRMRWDYASPAGKLFISDGKDVYLYLPGENRVEKMKLKESASEDWRAPLAFLLGKLNFDKEFRNIQARAEGSDTVITAEPKSENLPYSKVEFTVAPSSEIRKLHIAGQDQSVLDFSFAQEKLNPALSSELFRFQPPAGAEVE